MIENITSSIAGNLSRNEHIDEWWDTQLEIPFFDNRKLEVTFCLEDGQREIPVAADEVLGRFLVLTSADRLEISPWVYDNCIEFLNGVEEQEEDREMKAMQSKKDVWQYVEPTTVYIAQAGSGGNWYVQINCNCEWEQEHGLELLFKDGYQLTRVSEQQEIVNRYYKPSEILWQPQHA